jgi:hypothetical protein
MNSKGNILSGLDNRTLLSLRRRFWEKVKTSDDCWIWAGYKAPCRHGRIMYHDGRGHYRPILAHRMAYELLIGPIPDGAVLDHIECNNPSCVNPAHLVVTTSWENSKRGTCPSALNARKTHCPKGHPLTDGNVYRCRNGMGRIANRICKKCKLATCAKSYRKRKLAGRIHRGRKI